MAKNN